jgi:hypothetical protein
MKFVYATQAHSFNGRAVQAKEFLYGGSDAGTSHDTATQAVAVLDRFPDFRTERCDDSAPKDVDRELYKKMAIRPATQQEIDDYDSAKKDLKAAEIDTALVIQAIGKVVLDLLDQAVDTINQCRNEPTHTQRSAIPAIDRQQFWADVKAHYKSLLP